MFLCNLHIDKTIPLVVKLEKIGGEYMGNFDAVKYANEYIKQSYDRINLTVAKGKKAEWNEKAKAAGMSLNAYIARAVDEYAGISPDADRIAEKAREEARREVLAKIDQALRGEKQSEPKSTDTTFDEEIKKKLEGLI